MRRSILSLRRIAAKLLISETILLVSIVAKNELTFGAVISYSFDHFACADRELHATKIMLCTTAGRTKIKIKKWRSVLEFCIPSAIFKLIKAFPIQSNHL
jgi:hypothetical protein